MRLRSLLTPAVLLLFTGLTQATAPPATPKAKVSLVPFSSALVPGQPLELGIRFELEPGWHIYWQNPGDAGSAPGLTWKLPDGFTAGELRFPVPKKHVSPGDIVTNILKGEPVILTTIIPPQSVSASEVAIAAKVISFVCAEQCIQEESNVEVKLPVAASAADVKPANDDIRTRAQRSLPKTTSKAVSITPSVEGPVAPGSKFHIDLKVDIARGHHIQSNQPTMPSLIAAEVFVQRLPGLRLQRAQFPPAKMREDKHLGKLSEFGGTIHVRVPAEIDGSQKPGPLKIAGVFSFQACEDNGNCLPPESVGFTVPVEVTASAAVPAPASATPAPSTTQPDAIAGASADAPDAAAAGGIDATLKRFGLVGLLVGCFLYGLFINATPCVLPLLSIKVLGFVQQAHESRKKTLVLGLAFGAGVIVFFVILGLLASTGRNILQYPIAVILLGGVVLALALSMLGVFTLHVPTSATSLDARIQNEGPAASFAKGALAPVLGFACTGPLLAGIFGWATQQPPQTAVLAFAFAGLGMAFPYMLLGANPGWLSFLPRPGMWMITFERIMGFLLLAMVVWLVNPLDAQIGVTGLKWTLVFYVAVGMACWLLGKIQITMAPIERWKFRATAGSLVAGTCALVYGWAYPLNDRAVEAGECERKAVQTCAAEVSPGEHIAWQPWSPQAVREAVSKGKLAFVDFTAAYCTVCKVNKTVAIETPEFRQAIADSNVVAFQGDFTTGDEAIAEVLQRFSRAGVPLNLIYPPGKPDSPIVLEPNLSTDYLLKKLDEAQGVTSQSASIFGQ